MQSMGHSSCLAVSVMPQLYILLVRLSSFFEPTHRTLALMHSVNSGNHAGCFSVACMIRRSGCYIVCDMFCLAVMLRT